MNITRHETVLQVLTSRSQRYRQKDNVPGLEGSGSHAWNVDETGTLDTSQLVSDNNAEQQEISELNMITLPEEILQVHGYAPPKKAEGTVRLVYENVNGLQNRLYGNEKVDRAKDIHDELEVDIAAYCEHQMNMKHKKNRNGFNQLFRGGEAAIQSVVAHNVHENIGRVQQGGTSLLLFGRLTEQLDHEDSGKDDTGLGRWSVMTLKGDGVRTRIVCGYNPCGSGKLNSGTSYQQHRRFWVTQKKDLTCPRKRFHDDLVAQLEKWRKEGDRLVVCLDANEDIYKKSLGKSLTRNEGLNMSEVVGEFTGKKIGPTFFRGSKPIDGIWATRDIAVTHACVMPAGFGVGDHRLFVVDFQEESLVGTAPFRIQRVTSRRLNTKVSSGATQKYLKRLEENLSRHRLIERLGRLHTTCHSRSSFRRGLNNLDRLSRELMLNAEKKCRKIKSGRIPFSPEAALWIRRTQVYRSLLRYHKGLIRNRGNLKRTARRCGILNCLSLPIAEVLQRLKVCMEKCDFFRKHGKQYRRKHLLQCLQRAKEGEDESKEKEILAIIQREKDRSFWRRINYVMGRARGGSVRRVLTESDAGDGTLHEHLTQEAVEKAIFDNIHRKRFFLAEAAPICSGGLRGQFGYNATSKTARAILNGTFDFPPDFDQATKEILMECAKIREMIPKDSMNTIITKKEWQQQWRGRRESTSSSESGLHFGHYIAGIASDHISYFHALKATLVIRRGIVLDRWARGLSVMLEKMFGCALISKLRSILLMEADFNATNKIIYGQRMLRQVRRYKLMPEEIYSEKNRLADDGTLAKVLFYDIVRQTRRPAAIGAVDADNCYDRIAHPIASMVFQSLGIPKEVSASMLSTIQNMKFFLRTGFGDSKTYAGSTGGKKTQGLCQGNGGAPAGWGVTSISMIRAHKQKGHGSHLQCPITKTPHHSAGSVFVDDTDLEHFDMSKLQTVEEVHGDFQESVLNWGKLLLATGGALKPAKCFYHLISFLWRADGTWRYADNVGREDLSISVPLEDGSFEAIEHLPVTTPTKTLGQMTCPTGESHGALEQMREKARKWVDKAKASNLSKRVLVFLLDKQFWPGVAFGISSVCAPFRDLEESLMKVYYDILPLCGIRRSVQRELRQLDRGFYGVGLPHPGVECLVAQLNKLLTHYGSSSSLGIHMQVSMEMLVIEGGISLQILSEPFSAYSPWVTHSWLRAVWEKIDMFGITVELRELPLRFPREGDDWIMRAFSRINYSTDDLVRLNRVRCYQQVLFVSDVYDASGRAIDRRYLSRRPPGEMWSTLIFPQEHPSRQDFSLWQQAVLFLAPRGRPDSRLGKLVNKGHKIWPWRYDLEKAELYHITGATMDIYTPEDGHQRRANRWRCTAQGLPRRDFGVICSVREAAPQTKSIICFTELPATSASPSNFWDVLLHWQRTWMWDNLQWVGDDDWLATAIREGTCIAVTDGSYMKDLYPHIQSAAVVLECTKGRGRLWGSFCEASQVACSYRGELLGLMAIHLILLAINEVNPGLGGQVHIYSDCLGALDKVKNLPPSRIPSSLAHSDVLKNILVNCSNLTFDRLYSHVKAHQDDSTAYHDLTRPAQLNVNMDSYAKQALWDLQATQQLTQQAFPLEPVCIFAGQMKITADTGDATRFWAHRQLAREKFHQLNILYRADFEKVDWEMVSKTLHTVPRLFQQWACKQVMGIAGTMEWDKSEERLCPSCRQERDTCSHVLFCDNVGRVETLRHTIELMEEWLEEVETDPVLLDCIAEFAWGRGGRSMVEICSGLDSSFQQMARDQDAIGWRRFMEGMVCTRMRDIQRSYHLREGTRCSPERWARGLIQRLLEVTHGQWIYRNIQIHDSVAGTQATLRKETIQQEIEEQMERGDGDLLEEDKWMMEVNLGDLESTSGEQEEYWLIAIRAAREAAMLTRQQSRTGQPRVGP